MSKRDCIIVLAGVMIGAFAAGAAIGILRSAVTGGLPL